MKKMTHLLRGALLSALLVSALTLGVQMTHAPTIQTSTQGTTADRFAGASHPAVFCWPGSFAVC